jgi:hypothetical protein
VIEQQFAEVLRLAASIKIGTVTASLILRKLGAYPRQNSLALALREMGRIERTLFTLKRLQDPALRRRTHEGLNKGRGPQCDGQGGVLPPIGEILGRSFENQRYRASGLNLVVAAITLWNTGYLERAVTALRELGDVDESLPSLLFDHLVGAREQRRRDSEAECLGGLEIDDKIEFGRFLYGKLSRLRSSQDTVDIVARPPKEVQKVCAIRDQPTGSDIFGEAVYGR